MKHLLVQNGPKWLQNDPKKSLIKAQKKGRKIPKVTTEIKWLNVAILYKNGRNSFQKRPKHVMRKLRGLTFQLPTFYDKENNLFS